MRNEPKLHHYLPRSYLRLFADSSGEVTVRRRDETPFNTGVARIAAEKHLYSVVLANGTRDVTAEKTLASFDGLGKQALADLGTGKIPAPGSSLRNAVSLFFALQMTRTPEFADRFMFANDAIAALGGIDQVNTETVHDYLRDVHLQFEPEEAEVKGAVDLIHGLNAMGIPTKQEQLELMFDAAIKEVGPRLAGWAWSVEKCRRLLLATCDRLPAIWHPARPSDSYQGSGLFDADELWCPINPGTLLVLRRTGSEQTVEVEPKRFRFVNNHLARHCYQAVFHRPSKVDRGKEFPMAARRPAMRFWTGPLIGNDGQELLDAHGNPRMVIHQWVPIRD